MAYTFPALSSAGASHPLSWLRPRLLPLHYLLLLDLRQLGRCAIVDAEPAFRDAQDQSAEGRGIALILAVFAFHPTQELERAVLLLPAGHVLLGAGKPR